MRIAFITRATLFDVPGGDTIQVLQTANHLRGLGWEVDIHRTNEAIPYANYSLLHFVNITRPSDILYHVAHSKKPFVVTPILIDYSEFDRFYRKGLSGFILRRFTRDTNEYIKTFSRWLSGGDTLRSKSYLWRGQRKSIRKILRLASALLPNSEAEYARLKDAYQLDMPYSVVPNGVDTQLFNLDKKITKDNKLVVCAARIEESRIS